LRVRYWLRNKHEQKRSKKEDKEFKRKKREREKAEGKKQVQRPRPPKREIQLKKRAYKRESIKGSLVNERKMKKQATQTIKKTVTKTLTRRRKNGSKRNYTRDVVIISRKYTFDKIAKNFEPACTASYVSKIVSRKTPGERNVKKLKSRRESRSSARTHQRRVKWANDVLDETEGFEKGEVAVITVDFTGKVELKEKKRPGNFQIDSFCNNLEKNVSDRLKKTRNRGMII